jgi:hypothetical protein
VGPGSAFYGDSDPPAPIAAALCDDAHSSDGLTKSEEKCEQAAAKALASYWNDLLKCHSKCRKNEANGKTNGSCDAEALADSKTTVCVQEALHKVEGAIQKCADPPECLSPFLGGIVGAATLTATDKQLDTLFFCSQRSSATARLELQELELGSCEPIQVAAGNSTSFWDVSVSLSEVPPPTGVIAVRKEHSNGGKFDACFLVQPVFIFTRVGAPSDVRILDTGALAARVNEMREVHHEITVPRLW